MLENIFNNDIKINGGISADTLISPTLDNKVERTELDNYANEQYVNDELTKLNEIINNGFKYTGCADIEGLRKIGWTYRDIWYYQQHGVNWNKEEDHLHKVPQNNIDLYGVIDATNTQTYKNILVYLPKIDTSAVTSFNGMFLNCSNLISIPLLDTSKGTNFSQMFYNCTSLTSIPLLDTSQGTDFDYMFNACRPLTSIPSLNTSLGTNFRYMFYGCTSLTSIPLLDISKGTDFSQMFNSCTKLSEINLKGLPKSIVLNGINQVTIKKESILFIINNSTATSAITIRLDANNYNIYSVDADVIAALTLKPLVTLIK